MQIRKQTVNGVIPYILVIQSRNDEYVWKGGKGKKGGMFKTKAAAEEKALELSKQHPSWKIIVKLSNGIPI